MKKNENIEKQLLRILLERFKMEISSNKVGANGIIKARFYSSKFDGASDIGYKEIEKLIRFGCFETFANKYGFSLISSKSIKGEQDMFYEIIWDALNYKDAISDIKENDIQVVTRVYNYS